MISEYDQTGYVQGLIDAALPGDTVVLPQGDYQVGVCIDKSLTLRGAGADKTALRGLAGGGAVIVILDDGIDVTIEDLSVTDGFDLQGGGISFLGDGRLMLRRCNIANNTASYYGGGAVFVEQGELKAIQCKIIGNRAVFGGGVLVGDRGTAHFSTCLVVENVAQYGGAISFRGAATGVLRHCTIAENFASAHIGHALYLAGSTIEQPTVEVMNSVIAFIDDHGVEINRCGGKLSISHSLLSAFGIKAFHLERDIGNAYFPVEFASGGDDKYRLSADSMGVGLGNPDILTVEMLDLVGDPWSVEDHKTGVVVGAYASSGKV